MYANDRDTGRLRTSARTGMTLIELMIAIAVTATMMALLLPAVQKGREAASQVKCKNNLKQMGTAVLTFHDAVGQFPKGGMWSWAFWGYVPGTSPASGPNEQPLNWHYQILPYVDQTPLAQLTDVNAVRQTPVPLYGCPSRRPTVPSAAQGGRVLADYASATPAEFIGDWPRFWQGKAGFLSDPGAYYNGVIARGGAAPYQVTTTMVTDGLSNTMVIGEKWVDVRKYQTGSWCDDAGWADGWDADVVRFTMLAPIPDRNVNGTGYEFGSAHSNGINAVFGDGSVRTIRYGISAELFNRLGHRADGQFVDPGEL